VNSSGNDGLNLSTHRSPWNPSSRQRVRCHLQVEFGEKSFIFLGTEIDSLRIQGREVILLNPENPKQELSFEFVSKDN